LLVITGRIWSPEIRIFSAGQYRQAMEGVGDHLRLADVVGMHVGADHAHHRPAAELAREDLAPQLLGLGQGQPCVHHPPAVAVFQQIQIDVVERPAHGHGQPAHAGSHLLGGAWRRMVRIRIIELRHEPMHPRWPASITDPGPGGRRRRGCVK
jgi:hypothetical protein